MYSKLMMLGLAGAMLSGGYNGLYGGHKERLTPEEIDRIIKTRERKRKQLLLSKGAKEFDIDGIIVIARDRENAIRKVKNIKKLMS